MLQALFHLFATCQLDQGLYINVEIPYIQVVHLCELLHLLTIASYATQDRLLAVLCAVAILSSCQNNAGGQALHIPFPRSGEGFVEVVDVEDLPALRGGIHAEVREMRVPAKLRADP